MGAEIQTTSMRKDFMTDQLLECADPNPKTGNIKPFIPIHMDAAKTIVFAKR